MHHHPAPVAMLPVFKQEYSLPASQGKAALLQRNGQVGLRQGGLDMRRHVVGALDSVAKGAILGRDSAEKILQIPTHIGVSIFLDGERCRCVPDEQSQQTITYNLSLAPTRDRHRDLVKPRSVCIGIQSVRDLLHPLRVAEHRPASVVCLTP